MPSNIENWVIPKWHPDFGNPAKQLSMLRKFCEELFKYNSRYIVKLDTYEEGYMNVDIYLDDRKIAELHAVGDDAEGYKYGLFYDVEEDEKEVYFQDISEGLGYFEKA